ncbi:MAG: hypothetical protein QXI12_07725 [Candidatus Methanomethyliaceae archaeon]
MKRLFSIVALVISLVVSWLACSVYAFPGGTWVSGVTVANLDSDMATIRIDFYKQDGTLALSFDGGTIPGNGSKTWYLPSHIPGLPSPFIGSAVVSSDKPIAAIVNTQLPSGTNPMRVGTSAGVGSAQAAPTVYAPHLMRGYYGWNSYCAVQNTGSSAVTVKVSYYDATGMQVLTRTQIIEAYAAYIFDQETETGLAPGQWYSAKFEGDATHPLAVVCNFYNSGTDANTAQFHSYNGMGVGGQKLFLPRVVKDYYNYQSGIKIQNIGTEVLSVTVTYYFGGNQYTQVSPDIGPGQAWGPYMGAPAQLPPSMATVSGSGSAVVEVNNPTPNKLIIGIVNEDNRVAPAGRGVTYEAALESEASNTLVFPQVTSEYYGYSSGIQFQKVEPGEATCTLYFSASGPIPAFQMTNIILTDANPSYSLFAPNATGMIPGPANDNYNGAVTVNCTKKIVGIANLSFRYDRDWRYGNLLGDTFTTVRGIAK